VSDDPKPPPPPDPWAVVSYLISGVLIWGGLGWLVDQWLGTRGFVGLGIVLGAGAAIVLIYLRYSKP
jgi:F0F1-type ATP synthase assembly protein I